MIILRSALTALNYIEKNKAKSKKENLNLRPAKA